MGEILGSDSSWLEGTSATGPISQGKPAARFGVLAVLLAPNWRRLRASQCGGTLWAVSPAAAPAQLGTNTGA